MTKAQLPQPAAGRSCRHGNGSALTFALCPPGAEPVPGAAAAAEETQRRRAAARRSEEAEGRPPTGKPAAEGFAASAPGPKRHRTATAVCSGRGAHPQQHAVTHQATARGHARLLTASPPRQ